MLIEQVLSEAARDHENPLLPDDRDETGEEVLDRGIQLFGDRVTRAKGGESVGIGYKQFVCRVHGVKDYKDVAGRAWSQAEINFVIRLAQRSNGGGGRPNPGH